MLYSICYLVSMLLSEPDLAIGDMGGCLKQPFSRGGKLRILAKF